MALTDRQFGRLVRRLRENRGISLREAARRMGVSATFVSRGEVGDKDLRTPRHVALLAPILGVEPGWLRERAGVEAADVGGARLALRDYATQFLAAADVHPERRRFYRTAGLILQAIDLDVGAAQRDGAIDEAGAARLDELLRLLVAVVGRRHPGAGSSLLNARPKQGQESLYAVADAALAALYEVHRGDVEALLAVPPRRRGRPRKESSIGEWVREERREPLVIPVPQRREPEVDLKLLRAVRAMLDRGATFEWIESMLERGMTLEGVIRLAESQPSRAKARTQGD